MELQIQNCDQLRLFDDILSEIERATTLLDRYPPLEQGGLAGAPLLEQVAFLLKTHTAMAESLSLAQDQLSAARTELALARGQVLRLQQASPCVVPASRPASVHSSPGVSALREEDSIVLEVFNRQQELETQLEEARAALIAAEVENRSLKKRAAERPREEALLHARLRAAEMETEKETRRLKNQIAELQDQLFLATHFE